MSRLVRKQIDAALTILGIGFIFAAVLMRSSMPIESQLPLALLGVLLMEAGVWRLSARVLPSERRYSRLREEGDNMIRLVRELNAAALNKGKSKADDQLFNSTLEAMHSSVSRMSLLAGVDDDSEVPAEALAEQPASTQAHPGAGDEERHQQAEASSA